MTHWYKDETATVSYAQVDLKVNELCEKYKTQIVLLPRIFEHDKPIDIDVWFNFDTSIHILSVHLQQKEEPYDI